MEDMKQKIIEAINHPEFKEENLSYLEMFDILSFIAEKKDFELLELVAEKNKNVVKNYEHMLHIFLIEIAKKNNNHMFEKMLEVFPDLRKGDYLSRLFSGCVTETTKNFMKYAHIQYDVDASFFANRFGADEEFKSWYNNFKEKKNLKETLEIELDKNNIKPNKPKI